MTKFLALREPSLAVRIFAWSSCLAIPFSFYLSVFVIPNPEPVSRGLSIHVTPESRITAKQALEMARAGDKVFLLQGTYDFADQIDLDLTEGDWIAEADYVSFHNVIFDNVGLDYSNYQHKFTVWDVQCTHMTPCWPMDVYSREVAGNEIKVKKQDLSVHNKIYDNTGSDYINVTPVVPDSPSMSWYPYTHDVVSEEIKIRSKLDYYIHNKVYGDAPDYEIEDWTARTLLEGEIP